MISVIGDSMPNNSRICTPFMNKDILSRDDALSSVRSDVGKLDKLDTAVRDLRPIKGIRHLRELKKVV